MALSERMAVLRNGRVQQCDVPAALYARPADTFVARFVGTPPMNLVAAPLLAADPAVRAALGARDAASALVGVRPHDVEVGGSAVASPLALDVALVEPAGAETWVVGQVGGERLQGRLARGAQVAPGGGARFSIAPDAIHLFDAVTGRRL